MNKKLIFLAGTLLLYFSAYSCAPAPRYHTRPEYEKAEVRNEYERIENKSNNELQVLETITGTASFYGKDFHGNLTANGEVYDMYGLTTAHRELPFNTIIRVTNLTNGKSLILRVNDRGPFIPGRLLDCSYGAAKKLDFVEEGLIDVKIEVLEWGDGEYMKHD